MHYKTMDSDYIYRYIYIGIMVGVFGNGLGDGFNPMSNYTKDSKKGT